MRTSVLLFSVLALSLVTGAAASAAAPLLPAQDKAGALMTYQALSPADRQATLEAFTQSKLSSARFDTLDACTLRQTTEDGAARAKLGTAVSGCMKEVGF